MTHDFSVSLRHSQMVAASAWVEDVYRQFFPGFLRMSSLVKDLDEQRSGIDRRITLTNGRILRIEEKFRDKDYGPDILLEVLSDRDRGVLGWMEQELACDYLAYAVVPGRQCYVLPWPHLRRAWLRHGTRWGCTHRRVEALNHGYMTVSVAVPVDVLNRALCESMLVRWGPEADLVQGQLLNGATLEPDLPDECPF